MPKINSSAELARYIDHSILKPNATEAEVLAEIEVGIKHKVASICVMPCYLQKVVERTTSTTTVPCTVCGFPLGYGNIMSKLFEVRGSMRIGAMEIDYVLNISNVVSEKWSSVITEIREIAYECQARGAKLKIIFENCYLNDFQKEYLTKLCVINGVDWVKTSTGFGTSGATLPDVSLMLEAIKKTESSTKTEVKAAGGIKTLDSMLTFIEAGVTRCGCSCTEKIMNEAKERYGC